MGGQETRVTKISKLQDRIPVNTESCLVEIHGPELGKKYVLDEEEFTIGRDVKNNIVVDLDNVSRRHAEILASRPIASLMAVKQTMTAPTREGINAATARENEHFAVLMGAAANASALADFTGKRDQ